MDKAKQSWINNEQLINQLIWKNKKYAYDYYDFDDIKCWLYPLWHKYYYKYKQPIMFFLNEGETQELLIERYRIYYVFNVLGIVLRSNYFREKYDLDNSVRFDLRENLKIIKTPSFKDLSNSDSKKLVTTENKLPEEYTNICNKFPEPQKTILKMLAQGYNQTEINNYLGNNVTSTTLYKIRKSLDNKNSAYHYRTQELYAYLKNAEFNPKLNKKLLKELEENKELVYNIAKTSSQPMNKIKSTFKTTSTKTIQYFLEQNNLYKIGCVEYGGRKHDNAGNNKTI